MNLTLINSKLLSELPQLFIPKFDYISYIICKERILTKMMYVPRTTIPRIGIMARMSNDLFKQQFHMPGQYVNVPLASGSELNNSQKDQLNRLREEKLKSQSLKGRFQTVIVLMQQKMIDVNMSISNLRYQASNIIEKNLPEVHKSLSNTIALTLNEAGDYQNDYPSNYREENTDEYRQMMFQKQKGQIIGRIILIISIAIGGYLLTQSGFYTEIFQLIMGIFDKFKELLKSVWGFLRDSTKNIVSVLKDWVKNMWNYISGNDEP